MKLLNSQNYFKMPVSLANSTNSGHKHTWLSPTFAILMTKGRKPQHGVMHSGKVSGAE